MEDEASESAHTFHNALDYAQQGVILRLRLGNLMFAHRDRKFRQACRTVHAFADKFVTCALQHRQREKSRLSSSRDMGVDDDVPIKQGYIFLRELAKDTQDPVLLRDQIVNMLLAARDTTAGLLAYVFWLLARNPRVFDKLRAEVLDHYVEPLTYDAVQEMTYLRYVLQESGFYPFPSLPAR